MALIERDPIGGGTEHLIARKDDRTIYKLTVDDRGHALTSLAYLVDVLLANLELGVRTPLVAIVQDGIRLRFLIEQPWVQGDHPSQETLSQYLTSAPPEGAGATMVDDETYILPSGRTIFDSHPGNWIESANGVFPIDLHYQWSSEAQMRRAMGLDHFSRSS